MTVWRISTTSAFSSFLSVLCVAGVSLADPTPPKVIGKPDPLLSEFVRLEAGDPANQQKSQALRHSRATTS